MIPVGQGLFGECREAERCICGLCKKIVYGQQNRAGRPRLKRKHKSIPYAQLVEQNKTTQEIAAIDREINRKAQELERVIKKPRKPRERFLHGDPVTPQPCGCLLWRERRIKWCYNGHNPQTHPNECQHLHKSVQNFGEVIQKGHCLDCGNDIPH